MNEDWKQAGTSIVRDIIGGRNVRQRPDGIVYTDVADERASMLCGDPRGIMGRRLPFAVSPWTRPARTMSRTTPIV